MSLTPEIAKSLLEKLLMGKPILSKQGDNKDSHPIRFYQYELSGDLVRHILIGRNTKNGITAYINKLSVVGSEYPGFDWIVVKEKYSGKVAISGAAKRLPSLDPENNDVLLISVSNESALLNLLDWYSGNSQETSNSSNTELVTTKIEKIISDEIKTTIDSINSEAYALE